MNKGILQVVVLIVVAIIVIVAVYGFRGSYDHNAANYGTWSDFTTGVCSNNNQACTVAGTSEKFRTCTPNPTTGYGCLDSNNKQTFKPEVISSSCTPTCFSAEWSTTTQSPCTNYTDATGTTLGASQTCRLGSEVTLTKTTRTCIAKDATGSNACVKSDLSIAAIGDSETILEACSSIPACYPGTWNPCGAATDLTVQNCGGTVGQCGEVIPSNVSAICTQVIGGVPTQVSTSNCDPADNPGPCAKYCFNYPCTAYPAGFSNVSSYLGNFLEFVRTSDLKAIEPLWNHVLINCAGNPISTVSGSNVVTITTPAPHGMLVGQLVDVQFVSGSNVNGIPVAQLNGLHKITAVTPLTIKFTVLSNATSTGFGGGGGVKLEQDPEGVALSQQDVLNNYGPIDTQFASNGVGFRIRFSILPSQAEVPSGAFYMIGFLPHNGQRGLMRWTGTALQMIPLPVIGLNETLDDAIPRPDMFVIQGAANPRRIKKYTLPGPVLTELFCLVPNCINIVSCTNPILSIGDVCT